MANAMTIPAPVGGWNVKDALADQPEDAAYILDNYFPREGRVDVRPGYESYATGMTGDVETLAEYISGGVRKFVAAANANLWDISSSGAASSIGSGYSNNRWDTANMDGKIGFVNGEDAPLEWDGTTLSSMTISGSGLTVAELIGVNVFNGRSYFWTDDSQDFWYSAVNTLGGALTNFPLSRVGQFGGKLLTMGTWTYDGGSGVNDFAVFFMTSGETIVYSGSDPASFSLVGVFRLGVPISQRGIIKLGGDLVVITKDGYISLQGALNQGRVTERGLLSSKINPAVSDAADSYSANFGWQAIHFPKGNMLIFNIPVSTNQTYQQHVFNTNTGAPCRFKSIHSRCWGVFNDDIYFGGSGVVYKFGEVTSDAGADIDADCLTAVTYLGEKRAQKHLVALQPMLASDGDIAVSLKVGADFALPVVGYSTPTFTGGGGSAWDSATWDVDPWVSGSVITKDWRNTTAFGYNFRTRVRIRANGQLIKWYSMTYMFNPGGLV